MKLAPAAIPAFLAAPPTDKIAVIIYGSDDGLVRERGSTITRAILGGDADDPFRLVILTPDQIRKDSARLADEAQSLSLLGGRRVIRLRDATDAITETLRDVSGRPAGDALIVIEAGNLDSRSALRKFAEAAPNVVIMACYPDGPRELGMLVRETLGRDRIAISEDAVTYLTESLGGNRLMTRQELDKLALFAGPGGRIGLEDAIRSVGDSSLLVLDDLVYDMADGRLADMALGLTRLLQEGEAPVSILRAALRHGQRLHLAGAKVAQGESIDFVLRGIRPPIFYKLADRFRAQLKAWQPQRTQRLLSLLGQAEAQCKRTGFPDQTMCRQAMLAATRLAPKSAK